MLVLGLTFRPSRHVSITYEVRVKFEDIGSGQTAPSRNVYFEDNSGCVLHMLVPLAARSTRRVCPKSPLVGRRYVTGQA
jgi:hypothetical protein